MKRFANVLGEVSVTLWAGGLWIVGFLVVPLLFHALPENRALAGILAGKMFTGIAWLGLACGGVLLLYEFLNFAGGAVKRLGFWLVLLMVVVTLVMQFWLQPFVVALRAAGAPVEMLAAPSRHFSFWHGVSSTLYLIESLLAMVLVLVLKR